MIIIAPNSNPEQLPWYKPLIDDCKAILTEATFTSRWVLIEGYWNLGQRIRQEGDKVTKITASIAASLDVSERTVYYALKLYDKYPDINKLPEGKSISWTKLVNKYLPENGETKEQKENLLQCPNCKFKGKYKDFVNSGDS